MYGFQPFSARSIPPDAISAYRTAEKTMIRVHPYVKAYVKQHD
jgi:hypothetical protein